MASRRKRRRRSRTTDSIQGKRRTSSAGANFFSFIFGMATTVMLAMWSYTAINSEKVQADVAPGPAVATNGVPGENYDEIEALMYSNDAAQVSAKLLQLNNWPRDAELPVRVSANRKREKVARKLLRMDGLKESDRQFAADSLIEALSAIYGLDLFFQLNDQEIAAELKQAAESFAEDSNPKIVRASNLAMLKYNSFEYVKFQKPNPEMYDRLESSLLENLEVYSNDDFSISNVKLIFKSLSRLNPDASVKLTNVLINTRSKYAGTKADQLIADLADSATLLATRYRTMFDNRWVNGSAGREQLLRTTLELAADKSTGKSVIEQVDRVAQWFEQENKIAQAREIYQAVIDHAARPGDQVAARAAERLGRNGLTRCDAIGQPAQFSGVDIKGRPISAGRFKGRIVAVIYWSLKDNDSQKELIQLHKEKRDYSSLPVEIIAICLDRNPGPEFGKLAGQLNRFRSVDPDKNAPDEIPFTKQVPITRVPHILLIDQEGLISDTNVPGENLRSHIEHLSSKR